jgi:hypothetical protein
MFLDEIGVPGWKDYLEKISSTFSAPAIAALQRRPYDRLLESALPAGTADFPRYDIRGKPVQLGFLLLM